MTGPGRDWRMVRTSDRALLVSFGEVPGPVSSRSVHRLVLRLRSERLPGLVDWHPAYASLLVRFDPRRLRCEALERFLLEILNHLDSVPLPAPRLVEVPVLYGGASGPDLPDVARAAGLSEGEFARRHAAPEYEVSFLGFTAGFPYLLGLDPSLASPRLPVPRKRVPAGSVAVGGAQTGIYPLDSPGGWRLIGRTPLRLFDPGRDPAALLRMGDRVRVVPLPAGTGGGS